jgi:hypothetical protein
MTRWTTRLALLMSIAAAGCETKPSAADRPVTGSSAPKEMPSPPKPPALPKM